MNNRDDFNIDIDLRRKKRKRVKKRYTVKLLKRINVIVCALTFMVIAVCLIVLKRPEVSEIENRTLAKWPNFSFADYFSGKYTSEV